MAKQYHFECRRFQYWFCDNWGFLRIYKLKTSWYKGFPMKSKCLWFRIDYEYGKIKIVKEI